jgi:hypothetical protein
MANILAARMKSLQKLCLLLFPGSLVLWIDFKVVFGREFSELRNDREIIRDFAKTLLHRV